MAKCDLSIELDDPQAVYPGGGKITGVVRVHVDADVNCKGLDLSTVWRTHGRGNVASETAGTVTVFEGEWRAGENHEYRFELPIADWPPSYHGHYLSVDHYVDARAKIPWGFDPKASEPFLMRPTCGPDEAAVAKNVTELKGVVGCIVGAVFLAFAIGFCIAIAAAGPFALVFLLVPLAGGIWWFFRKFLPKYLLGDVQLEFATEQVIPGQAATGELVVQPRKNVSINAVTLHFQAREQCVSGSGSNRTTHRHVFFEKLDVLQPSTTLTAGQQRRFPLRVELPDNAPYSVDLTDNEIIWSATLRVDIPRWPDWVRETKLVVVPSGDQAEGAIESSRIGEPLGTQMADSMAELSALPSSSDQAAPAGGGITFGETAGHVWAVRESRDQVEVLAEAVSGLTFDLEALIERRLLYGGDDDPHVYEDGYAVWAHYPEPPLPLVLYVPHELADEFEQIGRGAWRGRGTVVGWDSSHGRLQIKLERPS